jgi:transposase
MTRLPEVISTVRRRRSWSTEEKVAILDAAFRPGGSVAAAADRFDVSRALIYLWRKQVRAGLIPGVSISEAGAAAFAVAEDAVVPPVRICAGRLATAVPTAICVTGRTVAEIHQAWSRLPRWRCA